MVCWVLLAIGLLLFAPISYPITPALWLHLTTALLLVLLIKHFGASIISTIQLNTVETKWFVLTICIAVLYWLVDYWAMKFVFNINHSATITAWNQANSGYLTWSVFISSVLMAPVFEELFFRGLLFCAILRRFNEVSAALISALLFALIHWSWPEFISLFLAGLIYAGLAYKSKSVITPIIAHMVHNLMTYVYYVI